MKVFITGGTGFIGGAVASALARAGHQVVALARNDVGAERLEARGHTTVRGDLTVPEAWVHRLDEMDAVIHAGHTGGADGAQVDEAVTRAMVGALEGTGKPFVYTSGVWVLGESGPRELHEDSPLRPVDAVAWRAPLETWVRHAATRDVVAMIVRPGIVYGRSAGIPALMARGELPPVGTEAQRWPLVHVDDLAALYRLAVERGVAGAVYHGVASEERMGEVAAHLAGTPPVPAELARPTLGPFADALALDQRVSARRTREELGWRPTRRGLLSFHAEAEAIAC